MTGTSALWALAVAATGLLGYAIGSRPTSRMGKALAHLTIRCAVGGVLAGLWLAHLWIHPDHPIPRFVLLAVSPMVGLLFAGAQHEERRRRGRVSSPLADASHSSM